MTAAFRRLLVVPAALLLLCGTALASIPTPNVGTPIDFKVGLTFDIKLKNANGCTFDYAFTVMDPDIVGISNGSDIGVKKATIGLTGLKAGSTMVMYESMNGTCPGFSGAWPVTVGANLDLMLDSFEDLTKEAAGTVKADLKFDLKAYANTLKGLGAEYKAGNLDNDQLQDGFHLAADQLRKSIHFSATLAYTGVLGGGSELLDTHGLTFEQAPIEMFAGGCGAFDKFQDGVCGEHAKFHASFDKASKKGITAFDKAGGPIMGQWNLLPPLYASGPVFPSQMTSLLPPEPLLGPLTITTRPSWDAGGGDGRLRVSGMGATKNSGLLKVKLTRTVDGDPPVELEQSPPIVNDEWTATFSNLAEGTWLLDTRYDGDSYGVTIPIHIAFQF